MLVPVYGFLEGDVMGLLVLAHDDMTLGQVADKLCDAARLRAPRPAEITFVHEGRSLPLGLTISQAGIGPLAHIEVRRKRDL